jgi:UDP-GlcNAc3NAcA epimerase
LHFSSISDSSSSILESYELTSDKYILCTIHRDSNTDVAENMESIFKALYELKIQTGLKIVLPIHPRTKNKLKDQLSMDLYEKIDADVDFKIVPPAGFLDIISLEKNARLIVTDSGGLQKEAFFFQKPCVILRPQTEWIEIVENGNAILADASYERIISASLSLLNKTDFTYPAFYGDGKAAHFICEKIIQDM